MHEILTCLPIFSCEKHDFLRESKSQTQNLKIPLPKFYKDMIPAKIGNVRFLAKIDIYVNSATEFAHLGHFGTEIRTFLKFCDQILLIFERSGNFETKFTHKCSATKIHSFLEFSRPKICTFHIFEKFGNGIGIFRGQNLEILQICENLGKFATEIHDGNLRIFISLKKSEPRLVYFGSKTRYLVRFC